MRSTAAFYVTTTECPVQQKSRTTYLQINISVYILIQNQIHHFSHVSLMILCITKQYRTLASWLHVGANAVIMCVCCGWSSCGGAWRKLQSGGSFSRWMFVCLQRITGVTDISWIIHSKRREEEEVSQWEKICDLRCLIRAELLNNWAHFNFTTSLAAAPTQTFHSF